MDISDDDYDKRDDDEARFGLFMYDKSKELPKFTPISPTITYSSMKDYTMLLNDQPENELTDLIHGPVYTETQTIFMVANPEGNPEELFEDVVDHQVSSPQANTQPYNHDDMRKDFFKAEIDLSRLSLNDIEEIYLLRVQGKLHYLKLEFKIDFINALLIYIRRVCDEVHKFCDGTLLKDQGNFLKMLKENKLGRGNVKLDGREWTNNDIKRSEVMLEKIEKILKQREQLRRLKGYVGGRTKTIDTRLYNYNMHSMGKTMVEVHAMLKLAEKVTPKMVATLAVLEIRGGKI
ncbi:hypothetical protein Tco_0071044 [Tanacetum coccineum]